MNPRDVLKEHLSLLECYRARVEHARAVKAQFPTRLAKIDEDLRTLQDERRRVIRELETADDVIVEYTRLADEKQEVVARLLDTGLDLRRKGNRTYRVMRKGSKAHKEDRARRLKERIAALEAELAAEEGRS